MRRTSFPILFVLCLVFYACKDNVVCPAFQSTYILDDSMRMAKYSYFANDSTPKFASASRRTKYGVNKQTSLFRKNYELMTAPKKNVLAPVPEDTSELIIDQGEFLAEDFVDTDTLGTDSVSTAPLLAQVEKDTIPKGPRYKYRYEETAAHNQEQVYYNKYYGELFIDNRPPPSEEKLAEEALQESDTTQMKKKGLGGLFKKKDKNQAEPESVEEEAVVEEPAPEEAQEVQEETPEESEEGGQ
ncbi:MAG: hypothetical protein R8N23_18130 [Reichenbachiella sp.]|uniref:hypothetical protein n=1 Tax=Reichenbachiella sp. TaxID=2184521 RepID=UPI00296754A0|nr:hypothetical protein [Reichenbachiella sp.]MDW3211793.1 hypothetical protein [Reichenbachiella sp.]